MNLGLDRSGKPVTTPNLHLGIDYDDAYKAVTLKTPLDGELRFETGDPVADYKAAITRGMKIMEAKEALAFMTSSSIDGFVFDVPGWRWGKNDILELDPNAYHADGRVKTKAEYDEERGFNDDA